MITLSLMLALTAAPPAAWTCDAAAYEDGAACDCGCNAPDPDCETSGFASCDVDNCAADQAPWEHQNDSCMRSTCGDGWQKDGTEVCDDFNARDTGGCNADCSAVNEGFICGVHAEGCKSVTIGEGEGEGEGEAAEGEGEGEAAEGEGEGEDTSGCATTSSALPAVGLLGLLLGRRRRHLQQRV